MAKTYTAAEALHKAAALCSAGEQCEADITEKLIRWGISPTDCTSIIDRLNDEKFIDHQRYCSSFVKDKFRFNKWGRIKIRYALIQKKINASLINEALARIDDTEYLDALAKMIEVKGKTLNSEDAYDRKVKLFRFAVSRGFEPDVINRVLKSDFTD